MSRILCRRCNKLIARTKRDAGPLAEEYANGTWQHSAPTCARAILDAPNPPAAALATWRTLTASGRALLRHLATNGKRQFLGERASIWDMPRELGLLVQPPFGGPDTVTEAGRAVYEAGKAARS